MSARTPDAAPPPTRPGRARSRGWEDQSIGRKGLVVLLLPILALAPTLVLTFVLQAHQNDLRIERRVTRELSETAATVRQLLVDAETGARGFVATDDPLYLQPFTAAQRSLPAAVERLRTAPGAFRADRQRAGTAALAAWQAQAATVTAESARAPDIGTVLRHGKSATDAARSRLGDVLDRLDRRLDDSQADAASLERWIARLLIGGLVLGAVFSVLGIRLFTRSIVRRLRAVTANAERLGRDEPLTPLEAAGDEIGRLSLELEHAARLLDERAALVKHSRDRAVAATLAKDQFLSRMSHELRTPLTAVIGFGQLLQMEELGEDNRESVDHIVRAGRHLLDLINEVLDIARIEAGEMSLSLEPIELGELVSETAALLGPAAAEQQVTVAIGTGSAPHLAVAADRQRLKQVLLNLLSNAIKYNRVGGRVDVVWEEVGSVVRVQVRDTGLGITDEGKSRVFVPFDRADATNTAVEGTGVGLSLSRNLVEAMGGTLDFTSTHGVGSTFWVDLPPATVPAAPDVPDDAAGRAVPAGSAGTGGTILYVEDNLANVRVMERLFKGRVDHLEVAMQGSRCLELAARLQPQLILLDLHLPDLSGEDVLLRLKADAATRAIPVVILSADTGARRMGRLLEMGAQDYLSKPLDLERLVAVLDAAGTPADPSA